MPKELLFGIIIFLILSIKCKYGCNLSRLHPDYRIKIVNMYSTSK